MTHQHSLGRSGALQEFLRPSCGPFANLRAEHWVLSPAHNPFHAYALSATSAARCTRGLCLACGSTLCILGWCQMRHVTPLLQHVHGASPGWTLALTDRTARPASRHLHARGVRQAEEHAEPNATHLTSTGCQ